ncbi:MAG: zf-HC2 domain-containing protein [Candidatus Binataceae bacterium]
MTERHPETEIAPYLRGELSAAERERVAAHLAGCARCRDDAEAFAAALKMLATDVAQIAEPDWSAYRAELHRKIAARRDRPQTSSARWWSPRVAWASMATAGAAVAAIVLVLTLSPRTQVGAPPVEQLAMADAMGTADIGLLRDYPVVEHLDLLENYDVIEHLDEFTPTDTTNEKRS